MRNDTTSTRRAEVRGSWRSWLPAKEDAVIITIFVTGVYFFFDLMHIPTHR